MMQTTSRWWCLECDERGEGADHSVIDKAAERHTKATRHGTMAAMKPVSTGLPTRVDKYA